MKNLNNCLIKNKDVLLRVDLNVPIKNNLISDKTRIYAIKSTVNKLKSNNNKIFLLSHFGRPGGKFNKQYSLKFLTDILRDVFSVKNIHFLSSFGPKI